MQYLEDYLDLIEHLPTELRDRLTQMRETDLSVQNQMEYMKERESAFFSNCKRLNRSDREEEYNRIKMEYKKMLEDTDEKIQNADECHSLLERSLRKLDQELHKVKLELEADNQGITEIIEKRSLEMDPPTHQPRTVKGDRNSKKAMKPPNQTIVHAPFDMRPSRARSSGGDRKSSLRSTDSKSSRRNSSGRASISPSPSSSSSSKVYPFQPKGAGGSTITTAASQQYVPGRITSLLRSSYEGGNPGVQAREFPIGGEMAAAAQSALAATGMAAVAGTSAAAVAGTSAAPMRPQLLLKLKWSSDNSVFSVVTNAGSSLLDNSPLEGSSGNDHFLAGSSSSRPVNPNASEQRYCICNQASYGDMVACDNESKCPHEWFHYRCVGITSPPKGKWYCPTCSTRRKAKK